MLPHRLPLRLLLAALLCTLLLPCFAPAASDPAAVVLSPAEGELTADVTFTLSFPQAMVGPEQINAADALRPLRIEPPVEVRCLWQSPTEAELKVTGPLRPGTTYRFRTVPGLKDLRGQPLPAGSWELASPAFTVEGPAQEDREQKAVSTLPRLQLDFSYAVTPREAADHIFFQDREHAARFPVEVVVEANDSAERRLGLTVTPRAPLPVGHTFDLVIDGLTDAETHTPLPYLQVFPVGPTKPLGVEWLGAFNQPLEPPHLKAKFSEALDPASLRPESLVLTPPVPGLKVRAEGDELIAEGAFDLRQRYVVQVGAGLRGERGFGLSKEERWGATFRPKPATLIFPPDTTSQRSAAGLHFSFVQVNTGAVRWTLSPVPRERLGEISARLRAYKKGEPPLDLAPAGEGSFAANGPQEEIVRDLVWDSPRPLTGAYVLEMTAPDPSNGTTIGNRTLIYFSEYVLTQKRSAELLLVRVASMREARPVAGMRVQALTEGGVELARATTGEDGTAHFPPNLVYGKAELAFYFALETPAGLVLQPLESGALRLGDAVDPSAQSAERILLVTDRNLYRPGQTVKMYGIARHVEKGELSSPAGAGAKWQIKPLAGGQPVARGETPLTRDHSWESEWTLPSTLPTGSYEVMAGTGEKLQSVGLFRVEEYRAPLFSVELEGVEEPGPQARVRVTSRYFHGAPNAGARVHWSAVWSPALAGEDDRFVRTDTLSEHAREMEEEKEVSGEAVLDAEGSVRLECASPFPAERPPGRALVSWRVEITSPEAQTQAGGAVTKVQPAAGWAGLRAEVTPGAKPTTATLAVQALDLQDQPVSGLSLKVELFHVRARTVKERVAPYLTRYRNTREFTKVGEQSVRTPAEFTLPVAETGNYVAVLTGPGGVAASTDFDVAGEEEAEYPVENEHAFSVVLPAPERAYRPGEIAPLSLRAPFGGVAWVTVETGTVLDSFLVPLSGNAGRIEVPVKKEYAPNVTVSVYLLQPGGEKGLPRERLGQIRLDVERPDRLLEVEPKLAAGTFRPGQPVQGEIRVRCQGAPVAGAEFVVFAVDEAVLRLGEWVLPNILTAFFPERLHPLSTFSALSRFVESIDHRNLQQKGYVVGGGGEEIGNVALRREFKTLAFWQAGLHTDAEGRIPFSFPAPDSLTEYRLIALGQTEQQQFGAGTSSFRISRPLLCEPALPRFVRAGDEVTLRAVVRQNVQSQARLTVRCAGEGLTLLQPEPVSQACAQDQPVVFLFHARAGEEGTPAKVRFLVTSDFGEEDAVEVSLPVASPAVLRRESVAVRTEGEKFLPAQAAPPLWLQGRGQFRLAFSTSPWLPRLSGLPAVLEYPHGCFEQISSRVLAYALMTDLLATLPEAREREAHYREMLQSSLHRYEESLLPSGLLPYWPGSESGNPFATTLAAWAVQETERTGVKAPSSLREPLRGALDRIIMGQEADVPLLTRCLALMVAGRPEVASRYASVAETLYLQRERLPDEARALLGLALAGMGTMPREQAQLAKEIAKPVAERAFDPRTFTSTRRAEAITLLALARLTPEAALVKTRRERLLKAMEDSGGFSTQENLWSLLAFRAVVEAQPAPALPQEKLAPAPQATSPNGRTVAWTGRDLAELGSFALEGLPSPPLTGLLSAEFRLTRPETDRTDRGLRVERVVRNLTEAARLGTAEAPFTLGDQLLITYRLVSRNRHFYVALEDLLPAGLETVNPDLPLVAKTFRLPPEAGTLLPLSHSELRDQSTCLYFDQVEPGAARYSILARATSAGSFHWPATQVYPMYDARFGGLSAAGTCVVRER